MKVRTGIAITTVVIGAGIALVGWWVYESSFKPLGAEYDAASPEAAELTELSAEKAHSVQYVGGLETPTVLTDAVAHSGAMVEMACATCHTTRAPDLSNRQAEGLDEFHQGLQVQHGNLSCLSCHNADNYDTLRLADGTDLEYSDAMQLCAQCHGPQYRDYRKGSHGGMSGYWDLNRGPRVRNTCTVCHDAHSPAYPQVMPVFAPTDLIAPKTANSEGSEAHH